MEASSTTVRVLCRKLLLPRDDVVVLQWLIGSPFFPPITVVSTVRCIHHQPSDHLSPDYSKESDDLRSLIIKGFHVIGALIIEKNGDPKQTARQAIDAARKIRNCLNYDGGSVEDSGDLDLIGGVVDSDGGKVRFFMSSLGDLSDVEAVESVMYEDEPEKYLWEHGCLLRCELPIKLPVYVPVNKQADTERMYLQENNALVAALKDPQMTCILETVQNSAEKVPHTVAIRVAELDFVTDLVNVKLLNGAGQKADVRSLSFSYFFPDCKFGHTVTSAENADIIQISIMLNSSTRSPKFAAPVAEYYPALDEVRLFVVDYKLDVLCYAARQLPLTYAISKLLIPALISQLTTMKNAVFPSFLAQHPQLRAYHFCPPGILHPVTAIYELSYGETETKQVEVRLSLHQRLGLPCDRPLLRVAYALKLSKVANIFKGSKKGSYLLRDVHSGIPSSGVSGGVISLVQGSYEYYHYLQEGFDDSGWGCAYRSLQTIISWFRLQHYTSVDLPSHREIQEALVDIGDKDPSFIGSREWIGAIELSYVLDKLLGVTCKVLNVRSGAELPEKCRELALHFENQGTPIMIGGGVLAYTLLGVDYNDVSGDCAFLILDPHYTGSDDRKKIVNGGWCGWKKAIDNKGKSFFLHDKFYNLLLPQRLDMV